jgi:pantothenate kinase-related protein Tda10
MSQLTNKHVHDITLAVSHKYEKKYEKMMSTIQENHNKQINNLISTQQSQATEIASIKESQGTTKSDLELQIHEKMEKQTMVLTSLVEIVQNMQNKDREFYTNNTNKLVLFS